MVVDNPVPNGVEPMTIALLLYSTVWAAKRQVRVAVALEVIDSRLRPLISATEHRARLKAFGKRG